MHLVAKGRLTKSEELFCNHVGSWVALTIPVDAFHAQFTSAKNSEPLHTLLLLLLLCATIQARRVISCGMAEWSVADHLL